MIDPQVQQMYSRLNWFLVFAFIVGLLEAWFFSKRRRGKKK
jgi:uncharacterized membrane protein affecting hemolysin expression